MLYWILKQHGWRGRGRTLKGKQRDQERDSHEKWGRRFLPAAIIVVSIAFAAQISRGIIDGVGWNAYLIPGVHGIFGIIGIGLLLIMTNMGKRASAERKSGGKWNHLKISHGRAADIVVILALLHGFIGFLYIFEVL